MLPHANTNRKKAEVAILISDYFKVIDSTNDKQGHFKNKGVNQEDVTILNKYAHNNRVSKYMK